MGFNLISQYNRVYCLEPIPLISRNILLGFFIGLTIITVGLSLVIIVRGKETYTNLKRMCKFMKKKTRNKKSNFRTDDEKKVIELIGRALVGRTNSKTAKGSKNSKFVIDENFLK